MVRCILHFTNGDRTPTEQWQCSLQIKLSCMRSRSDSEPLHHSKAPWMLWCVMRFSENLGIKTELLKSEITILNTSCIWIFHSNIDRGHFGQLNLYPHIKQSHSTITFSVNYITISPHSHQILPFASTIGNIAKTPLPQ